MEVNLALHGRDCPTQEEAARPFQTSNYINASVGNLHLPDIQHSISLPSLRSFHLIKTASNSFVSQTVFQKKAARSIPAMEGQQGIKRKAEASPERTDGVTTSKSIKTIETDSK